MIDFLQEHPFFLFAILFNGVLWLTAVGIIFRSDRFRYKWLWVLLTLCAPGLFEIQAGDSVWDGQLWGADVHIHCSWSLHLGVLAVFVYWFLAPRLGMARNSPLP